ncbi:TPA: SLC13 family permease [Mannheimia haemolytica]|uniref:SLC13 family permease n=1 Tax=Mannheimia haemolytica TaxID=75985 RepID=UPI0011BB04C3|nr:SLC13 family permease [Mannheimia haemolytica]QEB65074.1 SLC13 family permease [Mannheimia haemolytica]QEB99180.1 SLC13 family permease [Mannheimia haemolytica]QEC04117.1 SLC13 family permease [Mannheimia haemolytica]HDL2148593.1 SLC13 family permease [Mannheimia haemolytica]HDL2150369.1 SLC13 family permease [Mannheimia haemolytica]
MQSLLSFVPDFLKQELFWVMALLVFAIWQFIQNKLRMDVVALIVMLFFSLTNILSVKEVLAGLSDPNVVLIALLFIVGEGLVRTGVANQVSDWLMRVSGASETKVLVLLMLCIAGLGSFMSSTGIVAIFIPVVLAICSGMGISPRRLMMPLSVAGLISGMMTLIATPPNLVAHSELVKSGFEGFNFFSFTPIGLIILVMGIGYMLIARRWLDNGEQSNTHSQAQKFSMSQLIEEYQLKERAKMVLVEADSDCVGKSIGQLNLRIEQGLNIIAIQRTKRFRKITVSASVNEIFQPKDILLLDTALDDETYQQRCEQLKLRSIELKGEYFSSQYRSVGMAEISVMPEAECIGKTIRELKFRSRYHLSIVGLKRGDEIIQEELLDTPLKFGDILLVMGVWQQIHRMDDDHRDFFLLRDPAESKNAPPALSQAPHALFSVLTMVLLMITGIVPNVMAALIACLMLGKFRCVDMKSAYDSIHMPSIVLIVGMMPFSIALQKTGGVDLTVRLLLDAMQGLDVHFVLIVLFVVTAIISAFISNTATAILVMPIAIAIANQLGYSPAPFVMTVAVSASAAFMTPVSSPVNTMVLAPAGYKFIDFVKVGVPFTVLVMLVSVFVIPMLFPL